MALIIIAGAILAHLYLKDGPNYELLFAWIAIGMIIHGVDSIFRCDKLRADLKSLKKDAE